MVICVVEQERAGCRDRASAGSVAVPVNLIPKDPSHAKAKGIAVSASKHGILSSRLRFTQDINNLIVAEVFCVVEGGLFFPVQHCLVSSVY